MRLLFADNFFLFSKSASTLRCMIAKLQCETQKISSETNSSKKKWMRNEGAVDVFIVIDDKEVEEVAEYVYVGHLMNCSYFSQSKISGKKRAEWVAFNRIKIA